MKISKKRLRQVVRQILLKESAASFENLGDDLFIKISYQKFKNMYKKLSDIYDPPTLQNINIEIIEKIESGSVTQINKVGIARMKKHYSKCNGAYEVWYAEVDPDWRAAGFGPLLGDIALEIAGPHGVICDQTSISSDAGRLLQHYFNYVSDVFTEDLDLESCDTSHLTDEEIAMIKSGDMEQPWHQKVYYSVHQYNAGNQPTIERLRKMGKINI